MGLALMIRILSSRSVNATTRNLLPNVLPNSLFGRVIRIGHHGRVVISKSFSRFLETDAVLAFVRLRLVSIPLEIHT